MDFGRLIDNRTPMAVRCAVMDDPDGREQVVMVAKITWSVTADGTVLLANPPAPVRFQAARREGPGTSLRYPDNLVQQQPGTDVVMLGTAQPPDRSSTSMDVSLRVGNGKALVIDKTVRLYGRRVWQKGFTGGVTPGPPAALAPTPLIYENAYGGSDDSVPDKPLVDVRNPVGRGIARDPSTLIDSEVPSLEDPQQPLSSRKPAPAGFGPIPPQWMPLLAYSGTYDETWKRERAPIRPLDFNTRFDCCAPDDQHSEVPLTGDEMYEIGGVLQSGRLWRFQLPLYRPTFAAKRRDEDHDRPLETHLDTVFIDADDELVEMTWRASMPMPIVPQLLDWMRVGSTDPFPSSVHKQISEIGRAALEPSP